jgi:hypothetical protein
MLTQSAAQYSNEPQPSIWAWRALVCRLHLGYDAVAASTAPPHTWLVEGYDNCDDQAPEVPRRLYLLRERIRLMLRLACARSTWCWHARDGEWVHVNGQSDLTTDRCTTW